MEDGVDGGIIEASYDHGKIWLNVLGDTIFRPLVVGQLDWDTLFNHQVGVIRNQRLVLGGALLGDLL